jgi:hypothetical protein
MTNFPFPLPTGLTAPFNGVLIHIKGAGCLLNILNANTDKCSATLGTVTQPKMTLVIYNLETQSVIENETIYPTGKNTITFENTSTPKVSGLIDFSMMPNLSTLYDELPTPESLQINWELFPCTFDFTNAFEGLFFTYNMREISKIQFYYTCSDEKPIDMGPPETVGDSIGYIVKPQLTELLLQGTGFDKKIIDSENYFVFIEIESCLNNLAPGEETFNYYYNNGFIKHTGQCTVYSMIPPTKTQTVKVYCSSLVLSANQP